MFLQLAEPNVQLSANCGLPPIKPLRSRDKAPDKWREYDAKLKKYNECRTGKGKPTAGSRNPLAVAGLAAGRALFLAMLTFNLDGLATKMARRDWKQLQAMWLKAGGNPKKLSDAINKGKGKKVKKIGFIDKFKGKQLSEDIFLSQEPDGELKALVISASTAAGTAIGSAVPAIGTAAGAAGGASLGSVIVTLLPTILQAANDKIADIDGSTPPPVAPVPEGEDIPETTTGGANGGANGGETFFQKNKFLIIGGAVAAAGLIYFLTRKK